MVFNVILVNANAGIYSMLILYDRKQTKFYSV